jgi:dolichol-phosphate mannosyltransferase
MPQEPGGIEVPSAADEPKSNLDSELPGGVLVRQTSETAPANGKPPASGPSLTVVIPTRNEAENIGYLVKRLLSALPSEALQIIFVDDSDDDTVEAIKQLQRRLRCAIEVIHRDPENRTGGLGSAVVLGLTQAQAPWVCVMDADLQHPPELIPSLLNRASETEADLVVASRYCANGTASGLNRLRSMVSHGSSTAARLLFRKHLNVVSDPMSGFFLVRRAALNTDQLQPNGFKILLEILVRHPQLRVAEVGFRFGHRYAGQSKASISEGLRYFSHLAHLRFTSGVMEFMRFGIVGLTGMLVNIVLLLFATEVLSIYYLVSAVLATQGSSLSNFVLTDRWVFSNRRTNLARKSWTSRLLLFLGMNNVALFLRGPLILFLTEFLFIHYALSTLLSLIVVAVLRFFVSDLWIWGKELSMHQARSGFSYDIHGIVTVRSEVALPELQRFMSSESIARPLINVRIGRVNSHRSPAHSEVHAQQFSYQEQLGNLGFCIEVKIGETIDVVASPILRWSPHVLYTNVVEPILRWTFVQRGYALVHGACISYGGEAYLLTARTDTGKTTTVLRILARQRRATDNVSFISDDLTLVSADRRVLSYPKPLTISRHTVAAIAAHVLTPRERAKLLVQSRLHSRSGRRVAFWLSRSRLPVATINAIVQLLIPPPKYAIDRLIPSVKLARDAILAGVFVIDREGEGDRLLDPDEAQEILLANCEDAYGFPPYHAIRSLLHSSNGLDLPAIERAIIAQATAEIPARLVHSTAMSWADRIPQLVAAQQVQPFPSRLMTDGSRPVSQAAT